MSSRRAAAPVFGIVVRRIARSHLRYPPAAPLAQYRPHSAMSLKPAPDCPAVPRWVIRRSAACTASGVLCANAVSTTASVRPSFAAQSVSAERKPWTWQGSLASRSTFNKVMSEMGLPPDRGTQSLCPPASMPIPFPIPQEPRLRVEPCEPCLHHVIGWYRPQMGLKVEFSPSRKPHLARAHPGQNQQFERQSPERGLALESDNERRQRDLWHRLAVVPFFHLPGNAAPCFQTASDWRCRTVLCFAP